MLSGMYANCFKCGISANSNNSYFTLPDEPGNCSIMNPWPMILV